MAAREEAPDNPRDSSGTLTMKRSLTLGAIMVAAIAHIGGAQTDSTRQLTLGDAARLAAQQSGTAVAASYRAQAAHGRAMEARSALLPQLSATYSDGQRTFNSASFGLSLPGFNPNGEIIGPVRTIDVRA